jgi:TolA-binding protein
MKRDLRHRLGFRWAAFAFLGGTVTLLSLFGACSKHMQIVPPEDLKTSSQFEEALQRNREIISEMPAHPESHAALDELCKAIGGDDLDRPAALGMLIDLQPDSNLGLFAFQAVLEEKLFDARAADELSFCRAVRGRHPRNAVAAMALDRELKILAEKKSGELVSVCETVFAGEAMPAMERIARMRRAEYLRNTGDAKSAVLDYLSLWRSQPEKCSELGLGIATRACLREAGLILEAETFGDAMDKGELAAVLIDEFKTASASYFQAAPHYEKMELANEAHATPFDRALNWARIGRLAVYRRETAAALNAFNEFTQAIEAMAESLRPKSIAVDSNEEAAIYTRIAGIQAEIQRSTEFFFGDDEIARALRGEGARRVSPSEQARLKKELRASDEKLFEASFVRAARDGEASAARLVQIAVRAKSCEKSPASAASIYERFANEFPGSAQSATFLRELAQIYKSDLKSPLKAAEVFGRVAGNFPDSPEAATARIEQGLCYYEGGKLEDALLALQEFAALHSDDHRVAIANFFAAISEAGLGMTEDAERHMTDLIHEHPQSPIAPRAYLWLGTHLFSRKDFRAAQSYFTELQARFPDSPQAAEARQYGARMKEMELASK